MFMKFINRFINFINYCPVPCAQFAISTLDDGANSNGSTYYITEIKILFILTCKYIKLELSRLHSH
jgi:hypothetical protein